MKYKFCDIDLGNLVTTGLSALTGTAGAALGGLVGGGESRQRAKKGLEYENRYFLKREQELYRRGVVERGLTPQEWYGSPAPGQSGPGGNVGSTLGNEANAMKSIASDSIQRQRDRDTQLAVTKMQTDAAIKAATIGAGATTGAADIQAEAQKFIAANRLKLDQQTLALNIVHTASKLRIEKQQLKKLINEVATSDPKFVMLMKRLSMGIENMISEYFQRHHGIDFDNFRSLPDEKREELIGNMIAMRSHLTAETEFFKQQGESLLDAIMRIFGPGPMPGGIEATEPKKAQLGATSSEPHQTGPNMRVR